MLGLVWEYVTPADHLHQGLTQACLDIVGQKVAVSEHLQAWWQPGVLSVHMLTYVPDTFGNTQPPDCAWNPGGVILPRTVHLLHYKTALAKAGRAKGIIYLL